MAAFVHSRSSLNLDDMASIDIHEPSPEETGPSAVLASDFANHDGDFSEVNIHEPPSPAYSSTATASRHQPNSTIKSKPSTFTVKHKPSIFTVMSQSSTINVNQQSTISLPHPGTHTLNAQSTTTVIGDGSHHSPEEKKVEVVEIKGDGWDQDPINPRNWSTSRKWICTGIISLYSFVSPLSSSMMAPGLPNIQEHYHISSETISAMTLSIFQLSFAIGPLLFSPLSEMYGRVGVLHVGNVILLAANLGCAFAPSTASLIVLRFIAGWGGSASVGIGASLVSDMFSEGERGSAMAVLGIGPLIGPAIGPIAGGFITASIGFKWVFFVIAIVCGVASFVAIPLLRETYAPVIRQRRARKLSDPETSAPQSVVAQNSSNSEKLGLLWANLARPAILLVRSAICFMLAGYIAFVYGVFYLMFATFPELFSETYGFGPGIAGLCYLGMGVGFVLGTFVGVKYGDRLYRRLAKNHGGKGTPEMRIPLLILSSFFIPVGLFWYGWSAQARIHWIMPIIGTGIFGFGLILAFFSVQLYLVDAFEYAASALAAASVLRSLFGFVFPLFSGPMFQALGNGPGNSLLAGLSILIGIPFPIYLYYRGEGIRQRSKYTRH